MCSSCSKPEAPGSKSPPRPPSLGQRRQHREAIKKDERDLTHSGRIQRIVIGRAQKGIRHRSPRTRVDSAAPPSRKRQRLTQPSDTRICFVLQQHFTSLAHRSPHFVIHRAKMQLRSFKHKHFAFSFSHLNQQANKRSSKNRCSARQTYSQQFLSCFCCFRANGRVNNLLANGANQRAK